jgi:hypothetical protein
LDETTSDHLSMQTVHTTEDVQMCLTNAVNELWLSKANNIDPSCAYPDTMSHLNTDRYALSAPDVPGLYDANPGPNVSQMIDEALRRFGERAKRSPKDFRCFTCNEKRHIRRDCPKIVCSFCKKTGHRADRCWEKNPGREGRGRPREEAEQETPARVQAITEANPATTWKPKAPVFPWGQLM